MSRCRRRLKDNNEAAATEIGYVFTFMLGVMLLSLFSLWVWDIEQATKQRWSYQAMQENTERISSAIERADEVARGNVNSTYAEPVELLITESSTIEITLIITDSSVEIVDSNGEYLHQIVISSATAVPHSGNVKLSGLSKVWVVLENQQITVTDKQPGL